MLSKAERNVQLRVYIDRLAVWNNEIKEADKGASNAHIYAYLVCMRSKLIDLIDEIEVFFDANIPAKRMALDVLAAELLTAVDRTIADLAKTL